MEIFKCPVCSEEVIENQDLTIGNIYFYCKKCKTHVEPERYEELNICPECDKEVLPVMVMQKIDYFCCENCNKSFSESDVKKKIKKLNY